MRNRFLINVNCFLFLVTILAFFKLSLPSIADDAFSKELISQCAAAMSAPIRFKVTLIQHKEKNGSLSRESFLTKLRGSSVSTFLTPSGLEKVIQDSRSKGNEYVVSVAEESMQRVTRIERSSISSTVIVIGVSRCIEFYPTQNTVIDNTFMLREVQSVWEEMTDVCGIKGDVVCIEDSADKWLCRATSEKLIVELRIFKSSKFVESKSVFDRNSKELLKEYRYSDFESAIFPASFFSTGSARLLVVENSEDDFKIRSKLLKDLLKADISFIEAEKEKDKRHVPYRLDPKTGREILNPPRGMSNEDFARRIGEAIEKLPTPKGFSSDKQKELAEKWKSNTELKPVDLDPPRKATRGYGRVWLYIGVCFAIGTAVVVGIRFWIAK